MNTSVIPNSCSTKHPHEICRDSFATESRPRIHTVTPGHKGGGMSNENPDTSRRDFLKHAGSAAAAAIWLPKARRFVGTPTSKLAPPEFPSAVPLFRQTFENWAREIRVDDVWTCTPANAAQVVLVTNWAHNHGYTLRPRGAMHGWSPLSITNTTSPESRVVMVDTAKLDRISVGAREGHPTVTVGVGALLEDVLAELETHGLGFVATPAPGDITMGGALAIDAHGSAIPARGEHRFAGQSFGSLSNLVTSITVVAWDDLSRTYALRTIDRGGPLAKSVLTQLGRAFIVEATMQAAPNVRLRCLSRVDIPWRTMFAKPGATGETFTHFAESAGRVEAIWYPFTEKPWLKVWSVSPTKPPTSREVTAPYNYPFSDNIPTPVSDLSAQIIRGNVSATPMFGAMAYEVSAAGLTATNSSDIWGWSKNSLLYIKPTTMRVTANGYALIARRSDIQRVLHEFAHKYVAMRDDYASRGNYPMNMPVEIRVTSLDQPTDSIVGNADAPTLSALSPDIGHPERDVAVWINILTFPGTPTSARFFHEFEEWLYSHYSSYCTVRVEWSKGWAYTADEGGWTNKNVIRHRIPASLEGFWSAAEKLDELDPHRVFTGALVDALLT